MPDVLIVLPLWDIRCRDYTRYLFVTFSLPSATNKAVEVTLTKEKVLPEHSYPFFAPSFNS